jgi:hypothetical protein
LKKELFVEHIDVKTKAIRYGRWLSWRRGYRVGVGHIKGQKILSAHYARACFFHWRDYFVANF